MCLLTRSRSARVWTCPACAVCRRAGRPGRRSRCSSSPAAGGAARSPSGSAAPAPQPRHLHPQPSLMLSEICPSKELPSRARFHKLTQIHLLFIEMPKNVPVPKSRQKADITRVLSCIGSNLAGRVEIMNMWCVFLRWRSASAVLLLCYTTHNAGHYHRAKTSQFKCYFKLSLTAQEYKS